MFYNVDPRTLSSRTSVLKKDQVLAIEKNPNHPYRRHDTDHNDIRHIYNQHDDTQLNIEKLDTEHAPLW